MNRFFRSVALASAVTTIFLPGAAIAEDWNPVAPNAQHVYMADADSIAQTGSETAIKVVRAASSRADRAYRVQTYVFECGANRYRISHTARYDETGAEAEAYDEPDPMEPVPANSMAAAVKGIACDGERADTQTWPSLAAFMDSRT